MANNETDKHVAFLDVIDDELRNGILRLNQKLKGMQAEIQAKLESMATLDSEDDLKRKQMLQGFQTEIQKALVSIENIVQLTLDESISQETFIEQNEEQLDFFRSMLAEETEKLIQMHELL